MGKVDGGMGERNGRLRAARERLPSHRVPGEHVSRAELADAVNAWLWTHTGRRFDLDDHLIGKWERGVVRYPIAPYRAALRAVFGVDTDEALGFVRPRASAAGSGAAFAAPEHTWTDAAIVTDAVSMTEWDLINRRDALRMSAIGGVALLGPLARWVEPLAVGRASARTGAFSVVEVEALETLVATFRGWRSAGTGIGRTAVVGQLADVCERLRPAPSGPLTDRGFLVAAELAKIAGSMAFDAGAHGIAQRHYVTAARLAKAGDNASFGAVALAALARQSFDLGEADDGLQIVALAQRGTRKAETLRLRAMLATREAWGHAQLGDVRRFRTATEGAEMAHAAADPNSEPHWLRGFDTAELCGTIGARYRDLARHDRRQAKGAVEYLGRALELRDPTRARNRAFDLVALGRVYLLTGEPDRSAATVQTVLPYVDPARPGRLYRKVAEWHREAAPFGDVAAVAQTRGRVREVMLTHGTASA